MNIFNTGTSEPKSDTQTVTASKQRPDYLTKVDNLTPIDMSGTAVAGQQRNVILHNFTLSRGKVTAIFQLPDYADEQNWYRFKEARVVPGVQNTADLQMEFVKYAYSIALENLSHTSPRWEKTRALLKRKGFEDKYFETTYKSDPLINKLYYIMRDNNLLDEFKSESYDLKRFEGRNLEVRWSSNGNLMSIKGEESRTNRTTLPASDTAVSPAESYQATREEFDL